MDMHPSGFPRLVGPAGGSDFSHFDFSSHFRVLPNTNNFEISAPNHDTLSLRSHLQPLQMQAAPGGITPTFTSQPLRLRDDVNGGSNGNGNGKATSPRVGSPHYNLLDCGHLPLLGSSPRSKQRRSPLPSLLDSEETVDVEKDVPELANLSFENNSRAILALGD